tara:strand:+ start:1105 stop:1449 length:345 start_codon:yes stop_codon:yes gene_type:complete
MKTMLNQWWKEQERKPLAKPLRIRHVVETAHAAGWTLEECYEALSLTWAFTEAAFETALRRIADEQEQTGKSLSNIANVSATKHALELDKREALSVEENVQRLRKLKEQLKSKG